MDFCKASHWSVCSKFCHSNVRGFHRHITFTRHRLANLSNFMHTIPTKIDPDNLKGCQICNDHINYNLHNIKVCHCHKGVLLTIIIYFIIIIFEAKFMCLFTFDTSINF